MSNGQPPSTYQFKDIPSVFWSTDFLEKYSKKVFCTDEDIMFRVLTDFLKQIKWNEAWKIPLPIIVTVFSILNTATFNEMYGYSSEFWKFFWNCTLYGLITLFVLFGLLAFFNTVSIDSIIYELKKSSYQIRR